MSPDVHQDNKPFESVAGALSPEDGARQFIPYAERTMSPPPPKWVEDAPVSCFACGLLVFVPLLTGLMALAFGYHVLRCWRWATGKQRALTAIGLAGGALNIGFWLLAIALHVPR